MRQVDREVRERSTGMLTRGDAVTRYAEGVMLPRDRNTLGVQWFAKGSGLDDYIAANLVDGNVGNIGISPVVEPKMSAILSRQQSEAAAATLDITGRQTPAKRALDAVARFNDSPMGVTQAIKQIVYGMRVFNRGAPIATVPIVYDLSVWGDYGMTAVPLPGKGQPESAATRFYLEVDWSRWQPVPFLPSVFDLEPTGNAQWPYWYRVRDGDQAVWVLLHHTHIIQLADGTSLKSGIGTSAVWKTLGYLAEYILINDARIERSMNDMADGLLVFQGLNQNTKQIRKALEDQREESRNQGMGVAKGVSIITDNPGAGAPPLSVMHIKYRDYDADGAELWKTETEDILALCFNEPLSSVVTRGGVGFGAQAETVANNAAEVGVGSLLLQIATALNAIYPRVTFSIKRQNDRAQRLNIETMEKFGQAVASLNASVGEDEKPFDADMIRQIVNSNFIELPEPSTDNVSVSSNENNVEATTAPASLSATTTQLDARDITLPGTVLFEGNGVQITQADVDLAIAEGRERLGEDFAGILDAEAEGEV